jgi:hypothetical protein
MTEHTVEAAEAAKAEELVEARKKAEKKALEAAQIEAKRKKKLDCKVFVKFGSSEKNDRGCKHGKNCHYKHPKRGIIPRSSSPNDNCQLHLKTRFQRLKTCFHCHSVFIVICNL